jgi:tripartite-type tricarboxylate transporter receptor subunit TctC
MDADRNDEPVGKPRGMAHHVDMTIGDRIERPGIERGTRHGRGLTRAPGDRKAVAVPAPKRAGYDSLPTTMHVADRRPNEIEGHMNRVVVRVTILFALGVGAVDLACAQSYPNRPVKVIVPTPAGGPVDVMARLTAQSLSARLGHSLVVDNRPGAGNTIGSKEAAQADPDGYTLLYSSASGLVLAPMLQKNAGYDPITSYDPIALVAASSNILVIHPSVPANSVQDLVAFAKANPGTVNFSSGGIGVLPHLIGEMFKAKAGIGVVHVPYRGGGPSINDVVAGQVQFTFEGTSVLLPLIAAGKLKALAVTSPRRIRELPDVPTMIESGYPGFSLTSWTGLLAPARTPSEVIAKLNAEINEVLKSPDFQAALARLSSEPLGGTPQDFTDLIKADIAKWRPIVTSLNLKAD